MKVRNTFIIFIVSGFWHGANWTFIVWGALNALYFLPLLLLNKNRTNTDTVAQGKKLPSYKELYQIGITFSLTVLAWVFFRAENMSHALSYLSTIFSYSIFDFPEINISRTLTLQVIFMIILLIIIEWKGRTSKHALEQIGFRWNKYGRLLLYFSITLFIFMFLGKEQQFIYFQF